VGIEINNMVSYGPAATSSKESGSTIFFVKSVVNIKAIKFFIEIQIIPEETEKRGTIENIHLSFIPIFLVFSIRIRMKTAMGPMNPKMNRTKPVAVLAESDFSKKNDTT